jgi:glycosyltransferase involved in cell wall biosynthesis
MNIAIVGIQGLPNNYGGFETLSEYLVQYRTEGVEFTVYCSSKDLPTRLDTYNGARLKYIPVSSHGAKGIVYDSLSLLHAAGNNFDVILILGFGPGLIIPFLPKKTREKTVLNFGGLDWKRNKWSPFAQKMIRYCESRLVKHSAIVVSDNPGIRNYIVETYHKEPVPIAYGGDQAVFRPCTDGHAAQYPFLKDKYAFTVTRIQSDNNVEMMLQAFEKANKYPAVIVGNWNASPYGRKLKAKYQGIHPLILLDAIYDRNLLDVLRSNCYFYVHGHSAGGTNPSLCEAMYLELPIFAFASGYNEETTHGKACYFRNAEELKKLILHVDNRKLQAMKADLKAVANEYYKWEIITKQYQELFNKIINRKND